MFMKRNSVLLALLLAVTAHAQPKADFLGPLSGENHRQKGHSYQGMDIYGGYVFSFQNQGTATVYKLGKDSFERVSSFHLESFSPANHANVASFGKERVERSDRFPVVYVSHCSKKPAPGGYKDVCYVERISNDLSSSRLVQTIAYDDTDGDYGYAMQWVVDVRRGFIYGYGNTVNNSDPANRHRIVKFRLPELSDGSLVLLKKSDAIENFLVEDVTGFSYNPVGQGLFVKRGKLYMPTGIGTADKPSVMYVFDLRRKSISSVDLSAVTTGELEDISFWRGHFYVQGQDGIWKLYL